MSKVTDIKEMILCYICYELYYEKFKYYGTVKIYIGWIKSTEIGILVRLYFLGC